MGEVVARHQQASDVLLLQDAAVGFRLVDVFLAQADVEHTQSANVFLAVGHHHGELLLLQRQRQVGAYDVRMNVVSVVFAHQSRRNVDAHHLRWALVDVFHQRCEAADQRFVEARSKESVDHHHVLGELGWVEVEGHLGEVAHALAIDEALFVGGAVVRKFVVNVEEIHTDLVVLFCQKSCHGQGVASVVAGSGKDYHGRAVGPLVHDGACDGFCSSLHQVDRLDGLVRNGIVVKLVNLSSGENLHITAKLVQTSGISKGILPFFRLVGKLA